MRIGLSFDLEDFGWEYARLFSRETKLPPSSIETQCAFLLDLLKERNARATFFCLGNTIRQSSELLKRIHRAGHELAVHGNEHQPISTMTSAQFRASTAQVVDVIETVTSAPVKGFRAPFFSLNKDTIWAIDILHEIGLIYNSSLILPHLKYTNTANSTSIFQYQNGLWELPVTIGDLASMRLLPIGGGYFRLLPYSVSRQALMRRTNNGIDFITYHHNYDFFQAPMFPAPTALPMVLKNIGLWFRVIVASRSCGPRNQKKLAQMTKDFQCFPLSELIPNECTEPHSETR